MKLGWVSLRWWTLYSTRISSRTKRHIRYRMSNWKHILTNCTRVTFDSRYVAIKIAYTCTMTMLYCNCDFQLTIVDTVGYGDQINKEDSYNAVVDYIDSQFEAYLQEELKIKRTLHTYHDTRIHVCLYFICPTGHGYVFQISKVLIFLSIMWFRMCWYLYRIY